MSKTDMQIGIRVTEKFKKDLELQAEREYRTVSNLVIKILSEYLNQCGQAEDGAGTRRGDSRIARPSCAFSP